MEDVREKEWEGLKSKEGRPSLGQSAVEVGVALLVVEMVTIPLELIPGGFIPAQIHK